MQAFDFYRDDAARAAWEGQAEEAAQAETLASIPRDELEAELNRRNASEGLDRVTVTLRGANINQVDMLLELNGQIKAMLDGPTESFDMEALREMLYRVKSEAKFLAKDLAELIDGAH